MIRVPDGRRRSVVVALSHDVGTRRLRTAPSSRLHPDLAQRPEWEAGPHPGRSRIQAFAMTVPSRLSLSSDRGTTASSNSFRSQRSMPHGTVSASRPRSLARLIRRPNALFHQVARYCRASEVSNMGVLGLESATSRALRRLGERSFGVFWRLWQSSAKGDCC